MFNIFYLFIYFYFSCVVRRSLPFNLYTTDQVHLLPGYPSNSSGFLQVAFYVQQPLGQFIGDESVLLRGILIGIIISYKSNLEAAIGADIHGVEAWFKSTSSPTVGTAEPDINHWKWIAIGVSAGAVAVILIVIILVWW